MTHNKMIDCWKLYLASFSCTRLKIDLSGEDPTKSLPEDVAAVAWGVHHGGLAGAPLSFIEFEKLLLKETHGVDAGKTVSDRSDTVS